MMNGSPLELATDFLGLPLLRGAVCGVATGAGPVWNSVGGGRVCLRPELARCALGKARPCPCLDDSTCCIDNISASRSAEIYC